VLKTPGMPRNQKIESSLKSLSRKATVTVNIGYAMLEVGSDPRRALVGAHFQRPER